MNPWEPEEAEDQERWDRAIGLVEEIMLDELVLGETIRRDASYAQWIQSSLNALLGAGLAVDGIIGSRTRAAIREFQRRAGVSADGVVGPETERALMHAGASAPPGAARSIVPAGPALVEPPAGLPALRANIVRVALQEWERWARGAIKEDDPRMRAVLEDYWRTGARAPRSEATWWASVPWSAAFISWVMRKAGAGSAFVYSAGHSYYTYAAKQNRLVNNDNPFKAYRVTEAVPRPGDLVCKSRAGSGATYDTIRPGMSTHCDIVVGVQPGQIATIGGNVSNSVKATTVSTDANGLITTPGYFAVIQSGP